jgi:apolipoprotein N-acyltransferase
VLGLLLALAFAPFALWWLTVPVVAASTLAVRGLSLPRAALVGLVLGIAFFGLLLHWLSVIGWDAWALLVLLESAFLAVLLMAVAAVQRLRGWPLWTAACWVGIELARAHLPFGGFPWGRLAFAQDPGPFLWFAALGGAPLVTFAVALSAGFLAQAVVLLRGRGAVLSLVAAVAVPCVALLIPVPTDGQQVTAALIQGNVPRTGMDAFGQQQAVLDNHVATSKALAAKVAAGLAPQPVIEIWPENSTDIDPYADAGTRALIQTAVDATKAPTLVGAVIDNPADHRTVHNVGIVWAPASAAGTGGPGEMYVKRHPVPFGEYIPFRPVLTRFITRLDRIPKDFAPGSAPGVLQLGPVTIGDVICFEVAYDGIVRDVVSGGAQVVVVQTNNATYGRTGQPEQQLAMTRLRAVETGRSVLVAATSGLSAVVAPDGHLVAVSQEFERWTYDGPVTLRTGRTVADVVGAWPELFLGTLGLGAFALAISRRRRERSRAADGAVV